MNKQRKSKIIVSMTLTPELLHRLSEDDLFNANKSLYVENVLREKFNMQPVKRGEVESH